MIIKEEVYITPYDQDRMLHIYLPDDIGEEERLPVLYMFDGHNLFNDEDATYGKSWGLRSYLEKHNSRIMVVGLECNHDGNERLSEFTPYPFYDDPWGFVEEKGLALIDWMINELKPLIDENYPTLPERENTFIGGSSMGGIMALYMVMMHSDVYSKAACVSPHIYPMFKLLKKDLNKKMYEDTYVYISWGGREYSPKTFAYVTDQNLQIVRALLKKPGVRVYPHCFKNDNHSEAAWEKQLKTWMADLNIR